MKVSDCKVYDACSSKEDTTVLDLAKQLRDGRCKHLIVVDSKNFPIGVVSSTDIVNKVVAEDKIPHEKKAKNIMTKDIYYCDINDALSDVYYALVKRNVFFCPVTENKKFKGIITIQDITKQMVLKPKEA
jgi:CBS domain-containing protein